MMMRRRIRRMTNPKKSRKKILRRRPPSATCIKPRLRRREKNVRFNVRCERKRSKNFSKRST